MNAVILAGGFGSRLKPLTDFVPKPMLPIANNPMLDYVFSHIYASGIKDAVLTLGYYPDTIIDWVSGYRDITAHYTVEDVPLGTAGGVRAAYGMLDDCFIVVSGDALEDIDYNAMLESHINSGKLVTIAVTQVEDARQFGLVECDIDGTVTAFTEKPENANCGGIINCGVYILNREVLKRIPAGMKFDFARDLFPLLVKEKQINAYFHNGYWSDIGSPKAYFNANFKMLQGDFFPRIHNDKRVKSYRIGNDGKTLTTFSSLITGRVADSIIGQDSAISSSANIRNCIVLPNVTVSGYHYGEIIGNGYCLPIEHELVVGRHDSTEIYKKFS